MSLWATPCPVGYYSQELDLDHETDILLFTTVQQMLNDADSFFENQDDEDHEANDHMDLYTSNDYPHPVLTERIVHNVV